MDQHRRQPACLRSQNTARARCCRKRGRQPALLISVFGVYMLPRFFPRDGVGIVSDGCVRSLYSRVNVAGLLAAMVSSGSELQSRVARDTNPAFSFASLQVCTVMFH